MILNLIDRIARAVSAWATRRIDARETRRRLKLFPRGCRVEITDGCPCGRHWIGRFGTMGGLCSFGVEAQDYRVFVDGDRYEETSLAHIHRYQLICGGALRRVPA